MLTEKAIAAVDNAWKKTIDSKVPAEDAAFSLEARKKIMELLKGKSAVLAGFFYRGESFESRNAFSATDLGAPVLEGPDAGAANLFARSYSFGPLTPRKKYVLRYELDGVEPFTTEVTVKEGLNIVHIPVKPTKPLVYIIPHSHYDPEWTELYERYMTVEIPHWLGRLELLHEQPGHTFSLCEEAVLKPMLERRPDMIPELRRRVVEGTVEPKGTVVATDVVMPLGESMIRQTLLGELIASDLLGIDIRPETLWNIDNYGISFQLPQILAKAGRKYLVLGEYRHRQENDLYKSDMPFSDPRVWDQSEFWLEGIDGSKVLVHRSPYCLTRYAPHDPTDELRDDLSAFNFHGCDFAPANPELVDEVRKRNAENGEFKCVIATSDQFFHAIENSRDLPVYRAESRMDIWTGSYESRVRGRQQSRKVECLLIAVETLGALAYQLIGFPDLAEGFREAWFTLLINHHHDPQMTPMFEGLFPEVLRRYGDAEWQIKRLTDKILGVVATHAKTDEQEGRPIMVFNTLGWKRDAVVEVPQGFISGKKPGEFTPAVTDADGNEVPVQFGEKDLDEEPYKLEFLAKDLPACGWKTFYWNNDKDCSMLEPVVHASQDRLENEHLRVDIEDGRIKTVTLKDTGTCLFEAADDAGINEVVIWKDDGCICEVLPRDFFKNAKLTSRSSQAEIQTRVVEQGPAKGTVETTFTLENSKFTQRVSLAADSRRLDFRTVVDWVPNREEGRRIRVGFRSAVKDVKAFRDIPFGVIPWEQTNIIRPVNSWVGMGLPDDSHGAAILPRGLCSGHVHENVMWLTLFRSVEMKERCPWWWNVKGDQALEPGVNTYEYSLYAYEGDWSDAAVPRAALEVNTPVFNYISPRQEGTVSGEVTHVAAEPEQLVVSAVKRSESGDALVIRVYNPTDGCVNGTLGVPPSSAEEVDFREERTGDLQIKDGRIEMEFGPYEIRTVKLT